MSTNITYYGENHFSFIEFQKRKHVINKYDLEIIGGRLIIWQLIYSKQMGFK